jgi:hypothetical protein
MSHAPGQDNDLPAPDTHSDSVWMTKAQLAAIRRITIASADRLARRQGWQKEPGNGARARILVPTAWAEPRQPYPTGRVPENPPAGPSPASRDIRGELAILTAAQNRADRAETEARSAQARAAAAEQRAAIAETSAKAAQQALQQLREDIKALDAADHTRRSKPLMARLKAALRGT